MFDEVSLTVQVGNLNQDFDEDIERTRAPDYTPLYDSIFSATASSINNCRPNPSSGPRLQSPITSATLTSTAPINTTTNQILNSLLNEQLRSPGLTCMQQMPLIPSPSMSPVNYQHQNLNNSQQHMQQGYTQTSSPHLQQQNVHLQQNNMQANTSAIFLPGTNQTIPRLGFVSIRPPAQTRSQVPPIHQSYQPSAQSLAHQNQSQLLYHQNYIYQPQPTQNQHQAHQPQQQQQNLVFNEPGSQSNQAIDELGFFPVINEAHQATYPNLINHPNNHYAGNQVRQPRMTYQPNSPLNLNNNMYQIRQSQQIRPCQTGQPVSHLPRSLTNLQNTSSQPINRPICGSTATAIRSRCGGPTRTYSRPRQPAAQKTILAQASSPAVTPTTISSPVTVSAPNAIQTTSKQPEPTSISTLPQTPRQTTTDNANADRAAAHQAPVSVSSTTRPTSAASNEVEAPSDKVEQANKACQVKFFPEMVHKCMNTTVSTCEVECQTDSPEKEVHNFIERATSPIFFAHPSVRIKSTPKRKRSESKGDDDDEDDIEVD